METHYPNLKASEKDWLVQTAALRESASIEELINSFLLICPERATHEGLTETQIREKLTRRFNDILNRKDSTAAETVKEKRQMFLEALEDAVDTSYAVGNPIALMNFYESIFTDKNAKNSDKFKAIKEYRALRDQLFPESKDVASPGFKAPDGKVYKTEWDYKTRDSGVLNTSGVLKRRVNP